MYNKSECPTAYSEILLLTFICIKIIVYLDKPLHYRAAMRFTHSFIHKDISKSSSIFV